MKTSQAERDSASAELMISIRALEGSSEVNEIPVDSTVPLSPARQHSTSVQHATKRYLHVQIPEHEQTRASDMLPSQSILCRVMHSPSLSVLLLLHPNIQGCGKGMRAQPEGPAGPNRGMFSGTRSDCNHW